MMDRSYKETAFVTNLIRNYYKSVDGIAPERVEKREFGLGSFEKKIAYRHASFSNESELKKYLVEKAPPYVSYSTAYYKDPELRPMERKGWFGSELVFDLDATDMNLQCQLLHGRSWVCENCLGEVKKETIKLVEDFLIPDFGFSENEMAINFSGNRGYHVHIKRESVLDLDANARKEISNYITGNGIEIEKLLVPVPIGQRMVKLIGPKPTDKGWRGKIAKRLVSTLNEGTDELTRLGMDTKVAKNLYKKRALIEMGVKNGNWDMVYIRNKAEFWKRILQNQAIAQSDRIDKNVTRDPTHLIRLPESIHGDTGLIAKKIGTPKSLEKFQPMKDTIAFKKGEINIKANSKYPIVMDGQNFGPYSDENVILPLYAGLYLHLKGVAKIIS